MANPPRLRPVVVAHHGSELYGSDRQLLESVSGLIGSGLPVLIVLPKDGPLAPAMHARGAEVEFMDFPVLRRVDLNPMGVLRLARRTAVTLPSAIAMLRRRRAAAVYVNTLILPFWLLAARLAAVPALCHVHEAYERGPRVVRTMLTLPLLLAHRTVVNSEASLRVLLEAVPVLRGRSSVVYNGVPGPPAAPEPPPAGGGSATLALVGRLSPNKGTDVALEALARLVSMGHDVRLDLAGNVFPGYEWFETQLRERAAAPDIAGRVRFLGFVDSPWPILSAASVALVPSRLEPFGNTAVEAQLARRPVVVCRTQGLVEIVTDDDTGLCVPADDADALAFAVSRVLDQPGLSLRLADAGNASARRRFSVESYQQEIAKQVGRLAANRI